MHESLQMYTFLGKKIREKYNGDINFLHLVKIKRNTEHKIAESKGKLRQHFKKWTLNLEAS